MGRLIIALLVLLIFQATAFANFSKRDSVDVEAHQNAMSYSIALPLRPTDIWKKVLVCGEDTVSLSLYRAGTTGNQDDVSVFHTSFSAHQGPANLRPILIALGLMYGGCTQIEVNLQLRDYRHCRQQVDDACGRIIVREDGVLFIGFGIVFPEQ